MIILETATDRLPIHQKANEHSLFISCENFLSDESAAVLSTPLAKSVLALLALAVTRLRAFRSYPDYCLTTLVGFSRF